MKEGLRVAFVASSGGHLEELSKLRAIEKMYDCFLVTEKSDFMINDFCERKYLVPKMSRKQITFLPKFIWLFMRTIQIMAKEKPDFVITTGALIAYPFCVVGKLMGIKVVYIESFARIDEPSLTGKLVYNLSDLFMVQWEEMLNKYPKSMLGGELF
jgi:UDP-N-acetylglucosamine:LPS N-acetylglucosamine transferase